MSKMKIFIDHAGNDTYAEGVFAQKIKERLQTIKRDFVVKTFSEVEKNDGETWEDRTIRAINDADIIIPIIGTYYLAYISNKIEDIFNQIIESKNKYLFPILLSETKWGSFNWLVKSNMVPEDNVPLSNYSEQAADKIINDLILTIGNIIEKGKIPEAHKISDGLPNELIFISHDHDDADFAELLKLQLEKNGITAWVDGEKLKIGQDWREEIDSGIASSLAVIVIMTPEARKSEYVTYEWAFAWGMQKKIFPLMLKQTQLHPRLESLQYLDFTSRNTRPYDKLIESIKSLMK